MVSWTTRLFVASLRVFIFLGLAASAYLGHYLFQLDGDIFRAIVAVIAGWAVTIFIFGTLGLLVEMTSRLNEMVRLIRQQPGEPEPTGTAIEA